VALSIIILHQYTKMLPKAKFPGIGPAGGHRCRPGDLEVEKSGTFLPDPGTHGGTLLPAWFDLPPSGQAAEDLCHDYYHYYI